MCDILRCKYYNPISSQLALFKEEKEFYPNHADFTSWILTNLSLVCRAVSKISWISSLLGESFSPDVWPRRWTQEVKGNAWGIHGSGCVSTPSALFSRDASTDGKCSSISWLLEDAFTLNIPGPPGITGHFDLPGRELLSEPCDRERSRFCFTFSCTRTHGIDYGHMALKEISWLFLFSFKIFPLEDD